MVRRIRHDRRSCAEPAASNVRWSAAFGMTNRLLHGCDAASTETCGSPFLLWMQRQPPALPIEIGTRRWPHRQYGKAIAAMFRCNFAEGFVVEILRTLPPHCGAHRATSPVFSVTCGADRASATALSKAA